MKAMSIFLIAILCLCACNDVRLDIIPENTIAITYPLKGAVFPQNFSSPTFTWHDHSADSTEWSIVFLFQGGKKKTFTSTSQRWTPNKDQWESIKNAARLDSVRFFVVGMASDKMLSRGESSFLVSKDSLNSPILYRSVPLPFPTLNERKKIAWKLGRVSDYESPKTLMTGKNTCFNCHAASLDGRTFGIEINVDLKDRGSYIFSGIKDEINLFKKDIFNWNASEPADKAYGANHSAISPQGDYVITAYRGKLFFVDFLDSVSMVSYFQPTQGILGYKTKSSTEIIPLKGADDPNFSYTSPDWSPDGKTIAFARAPLDKRILPNDNEKMWVKQSWQMHDELRGLKFDIFTIDFKEGKGGIARPLDGASKNGKSNFFPTYSPDGKWLVYTQANYGFGIRPDCDLYIVPSSGGQPRKLNSNGANADSWHSWSPDSKWLAFASKSFNSYTQLLITHIDSNGIDSPPVIVTRFAEEGKGVNIPIFINNQGLNKISTDID